MVQIDGGGGFVEELKQIQIFVKPVRKWCQNEIFD